MHFVSEKILFLPPENGEMAERSIAAVLKTVEGNTSGGSNPSLSAERKGNAWHCLFLYLCPIVKPPLFMEKKTVKALFVNGGPRKNKNTALLLESAMRDEHFPIDLQNAYELGQRLVNAAQ